MRLAVVLALVAASCSDDEERRVYVPVDQINATIRAANCVYFVRCGQFPDQETCMAASLRFEYFDGPDVVAAIRAGRIIYRDDNVKACEFVLAHRTCDNTDADSRGLAPVCSHFYEGTVRGGGACTSDLECISQSCVGATGAPACASGTCMGDTPPTDEPAPIGMSCTYDLDCDYGAYCDQATTVCAAMKIAGAACANDVECSYGLGCAGSPGERVCKPLPTIDEPCPDGVCRDLGLYCASTGTCKPVGLSSASCTSSDECALLYPCDPATNTCEHGPSLGESCAPGRRCFTIDTYCDTTTYTCTKLAPDGAACTSSDVCASDFCDDTATPPVCAPKPVCL